MGFDIVQITQQISVGPSVSPGWPAFARWIKTQLPTRSITGHKDSQNDLRGWSDSWSNKEKSYSQKQQYDEAVLSTELVGLLESPPLSLSNSDAIALRNHLIDMGLLVAHKFYKQKPCHSIIQFRV